MIYRIGAHTLQPCRIELPPSKSIANRITLLRALAGMPQTTDNAACNDIAAMQHAIGNTDNIIDIGDAGTAMRFLTAYYAALSGREHTLTGSSRMQQRPIGALVEALRAAGASIRYIDKEGFPPLAIQGGLLQGGEITIKGDISSQFITALLLVAPLMRDGLHLTIIGNIVSRPYIEMTIELMRSFGATITCHDNSIKVAPQRYTPAAIEIEGDWSAASYWYEICALSEQATVCLPGLFRESPQGDSEVARLFEQLGVETVYGEREVTLQKTGKITARMEYDFVNQPDLAQTFVVTCAVMGIPFRFSGLQSLKIKETDRIAALIAEMKKLGYLITESEGSVLSWNGERCTPDASPCIDTYEDHRMAMAFAPACIRLGDIYINHPQVVTKSYPHYWENLIHAGFNITEE